MNKLKINQKNKIQRMKKKTMNKIVAMILQKAIGFIRITLILKIYRKIMDYGINMKVFEELVAYLKNKKKQLNQTFQELQHSLIYKKI